MTMHPYLIFAEKEEHERRSQGSGRVRVGEIVQAKIIKRREFSVYCKLNDKGLIGCLHITDCGKNMEEFQNLKKGDLVDVYVKSISEEKYRIADLSLSKKSAQPSDLTKGKKMKVVVRRFNKFASYPLLVEASRTHIGSVLFSDLDGSQTYLPGQIVHAYYLGEEDQKQFFSLKSDKKDEIEVGSLIDCRFVSFKPGFGATIQMSKTEYGFVDITEISDELEPRIDLVLKKKALFSARVIEINKGKYQLSTRESLVDAEKYHILGLEGTSLEYKHEFGDLEKQGDL